MSAEDKPEPEAGLLSVMGTEETRAASLGGKGKYRVSLACRDWGAK